MPSNPIHSPSDAVGQSLRGVADVLTPLDASRWPKDLSQLYSNLLHILDSAEKFSTPETIETRRTHSLELKKALITVREELRSLLPAVQLAALDAGTTFPTGNSPGAPILQSACEFVEWLARSAAELHTLPADDTPGPMPCKFRAPTPNEERTRELRAKKATERFSILRQQLTHEIGVAARLRLNTADQHGAARQDGARGSGAQCVHKDWDFSVAGQFRYRDGQFHHLPRSLLDLLKEFVSARGMTLTEAAIRTLTEKDVELGTVYRRVSQLRNKLRSLLKLPSGFDPIPSVGEKAWKLKLPEA
jgi:hypothetical protein